MFGTIEKTYKICVVKTSANKRPMGHIVHLRKSFDESNVEIKKGERQTEMKKDRKRMR